MAYPVITNSYHGITIPDVHIGARFLQLSPRKIKGKKSYSQLIRSNRRKKAK